jgi:hypothetical protein
MKYYGGHSPNQNQDDYDEKNYAIQDYKEYPPVSPQPTYKEIFATYFDITGTQYQIFKNTVPYSGELQLCAITQGVPVNHVDVEEMRQIHRNRNLAARRRFIDFRRRVQSFMCLNVFYIVVLIITINSSFSDFRTYQDECPNYAKASLGFSILNIASIVFSLIGIIAAAKKSELMLRIYNGGIYCIMLIAVLVTAYGLIKKDSGNECDGSPPKNVSLIANGIFTLVILSLFSYSATKLKVSVIQLNAELNTNNANNSTANNRSMNVMTVNNNNLNQQHAPENLFRV